MDTPDFAAADWRDTASYMGLLNANRSTFAWEWLRRSAAYREAVTSASAPPSKFGLHRFEDPSLAGGIARPIWHHDVDPSVLCARARPVCGEDGFDVRNFAGWTSLHVGEDGEHWRIGQGFRAIRLDLVDGTLQNGPICLDYLISGLIEAMPVVLTLRRFLALAGTRQWRAKLYPAERRAGRWITQLRVHDAVAAGASQREIAVAFFGDRIIGKRWRADAPSLRLRIQRLVASTRLMTIDGWRQLLVLP